MIPAITIDGTALTIGTWPRKVWALADWIDLWELAPMRGESTLIPGAAGRRRNPQRVDERIATLPMNFWGSHDPDGDPHSDESVGVAMNYRELAELVRTDELVTSRTLILPLGDAEWQTEIQVVSFDITARVSGRWQADLEVRVSDGELTESGS